MGSRFVEEFVELRTDAFLFGRYSDSLFQVALFAVPAVAFPDLLPQSVYHQVLLLYFVAEFVYFEFLVPEQAEIVFPFLAEVLIFLLDFENGLAELLFRLPPLPPPFPFCSFLHDAEDGRIPRD